jgi:hypothetical protein
MNIYYVCTTGISSVRFTFIRFIIIIIIIIIIICITAIANSQCLTLSSGDDSFRQDEDRVSDPALVSR